MNALAVIRRDDDTHVNTKPLYRVDIELAGSPLLCRFNAFRVFVVTHFRFFFFFFGDRVDASVVQIDSWTDWMTPGEDVDLFYRKVGP